MVHIGKQALKPLECSVERLTLSRGVNEAVGLIFDLDCNSLE
jgi:hypothetical protein